LSAASGTALQLDRLHAVAVRLKAAAEAVNHRRALVLAGSRRWCGEAAGAVIEASGSASTLWISDNAPAGVVCWPAAQAHGVLGREFAAVIFDAWAGFDPDAFGAVTGTLRGGGLLLLLTPRFAAWSGYADPENARIATAPYGAADVGGRFLRRLVRVLSGDEDLVLLEEGAPLVDFPQPPTIARTAPASEDPECRTGDQQRAVEAIVKLASGHSHRRRHIVLTSDRGRGKSAALGIAAARLLRRGFDHIIVTGPSLDAVAPVFEQAHRLLPDAHASRAAIHLGQRYMEFASPDALAFAARRAGLLLVDEAATIPAPLLERLLNHYSRIAFATTVHGYEGTGRGFALRFYKVLDRHSRGWKAVHLETPVRWARHDPVERLVFRALLLDAGAGPPEAMVPCDPDVLAVERLDRDRLVEDEPLLAELFGLLVLAHYRTRPHDLRQLLDGPNLSVYVLRVRGHVAATALVAAEGGLDEEQARAICEGRRRPHGHLLPEALAAHAGVEQAPGLRSARIMRIAVHPVLQSRGLGTRLIDGVVEQARADGFDYVGSSFGATDRLLRFWGGSGFLPVRVGVKRGARSGAHSVIMLRGLSEAGLRVCSDARRGFLDLLPHQLSDPLRDVEPGLAARLMLCPGSTAPWVSSQQDLSALQAFACARRDYESCMAALWRIACAALSDPRARLRLDDCQRDALVVKVLQRRSWRTCAEVLRVTGRAAVIECMRGAARSLLDSGDAPADQRGPR
jgi:tRNA(Met) cytidine acetyltransferase